MRTFGVRAGDADAPCVQSSQLVCNQVDILCVISETWLNSTTSSHHICPLYDTPFLDVIDKVFVSKIVQNNWKLQPLSELSNPFDCLWAKSYHSKLRVLYCSCLLSPLFSFIQTLPMNLVDFLIDSLWSFALASPCCQHCYCLKYIHIYISWILTDWLLNCHLFKWSKHQPEAVKYSNRCVYQWNKISRCSKSCEIWPLQRTDKTHKTLQGHKTHKTLSETVEFRDCRAHHKLQMLN